MGFHVKLLGDLSEILMMSAKLVCDYYSYKVVPPFDS